MERVAPETDLIKELIEIRREKQVERDKWPRNSPEYKRLDVIQKQLKIIANAISYGIFLEVIVEELKKPKRVEVYGLGHRRCMTKKKERFGKFYNPIIGVMLTSGSRLMLAMAESWLEEHKAKYAFCDTDSMAVSPSKALSLQKFFQPLNPYASDDPLLKLEDLNLNKGKFRELWFREISAKRYVLFTMENDEPNPIEDGWSSHGLSHLEIKNKKDWERGLWKSILLLDQGNITVQELTQQYSGQHAVSKLAITTPKLLRQVEALNSDRTMEKKIKPYTFMLVGSPTMLNDEDEPIYPLTPFTKEYSQAPFQPFVDAHAGKLYKHNTHHYWKTLDATVQDYFNHPESKFRNGNGKGKLQRMTMLITTRPRHIGKEANDIEKAEKLGISQDSIQEYD